MVHGFRSGLEEEIALSLTARGVNYEYEKLVIPFTRPEKSHKYTPDWVLPNGIIVESKGRFVTADRQKHLLIKQQHPEHDIRFVFSNSKSRITKRSDTTYGMWCVKHGFTYTDRDIPDSWIKEN